MTNRDEISGLILAGGLSSRMGGDDKSWMEYQGKPMIEQVLQRLEPQVDHVLVSANRDIGHYQQLGCTVLEDELPNHPGPLAGIAVALSACETDWLLVTACDAPHIPEDLVSRLWKAIQSSEEPVKLAYPHDGKQTQHLFMLVHRDCLASLERQLLQDQHKVMQWVNTQNPVEVDFSDQPSAFININTPYELTH